MGTPTIHTLLIEDDPDDTILITEYLSTREDATFELVCVTRLPEGLELLSSRQVDVVLLDLGLPDSTGLDTFRSVHRVAPETPIIVITGLDDESMAVDVVNAGAEDYLVKGQFDHRALVRSVRYALERARRRQAQKALQEMRSEVRLARKLQEQMLPGEPPRLGGLDVAAVSIPARAVGVDYYDYVPMFDGKLGIAIGGATGQGLAPALIVAETCAYLRSLAESYSDPRKMLSVADRLLSQGLPPDQEMTLLLGRLSSQDGHFDYASAGHAPGYVFSRNGRVKRELPQTGPALGRGFLTSGLAGEQVSLGSGDLLLLMTDGITEAYGPSRKLLGFEPVQDVIRQHGNELARDLLGHLCQAVRDFCAPLDPPADLTAIAIKM